MSRNVTWAALGLAALLAGCLSKDTMEGGEEAAIATGSAAATEDELLAEPADPAAVFKGGEGRADGNFGLTGKDRAGDADFGGLGHHGSGPAGGGQPAIPKPSPTPMPTTRMPVASPPPPPADPVPLNANKEWDRRNEPTTAAALHDEESDEAWEEPEKTEDKAEAKPAEKQRSRRISAVDNLKKKPKMKKPSTKRVMGKRDKHGLDKGFFEAPPTDRPPPDDTRPAQLLPRKFYFENTYLGGSAAYLERLRRLDAALADSARPHRLAQGYDQPFDDPGEAGMALAASLDRTWLDKPGRVVLQVGLQGSHRYGWRRPPLDVMLVVDTPAVARSPAALLAIVRSLVRQLGPRDRLGIVAVGAGGAVFELERIRALRTQLGDRLDGLRAPRKTHAGALERALLTAGQLLRRAAQEQATIPGTQTVLLVTAGAASDRVQAAARGAHQLTVQGAVTSVIELGEAVTGAWWEVANAGHGNYHSLPPGEAATAVSQELQSLSRVVARLLRLNVRLAPNVHAIRVLGSRKLEDEEVKRVKAREEAVDKSLSATLGVKSDRGEDDDGVQTVIPYFYGGDAHVVLIELWVEKPGPVADVTLKYKDMVGLTNATAHDGVSIAARPRAETPEQRLVRLNVRGFTLAEDLQEAAQRLQRGEPGTALAVIRRARRLGPAPTVEDARMLDEFEALVGARGAHQQALVSDALRLASQRKLGLPAR